MKNNSCTVKVCRYIHGMMKHGARKIHRNFKLQPKLNEALKRIAKRTHRTQTAIIEMALEEFLGKEAA